MRAISVVLCRFRVSKTVVVHAAGLVCKVFQTIPLGTRLSIDVNFVVHCLPVCEVGEVDLLLMELLAAETRELNVVQWPVELDVFACADLLRSSLDYSRSEEVNGFQVLAVDALEGTGADSRMTTYTRPHLSCHFCRRIPKSNLEACLPPSAARQRLGTYTRPLAYLLSWSRAFPERSEVLAPCYSVLGYPIAGFELLKGRPAVSYGSSGSPHSVVPAVTPHFQDFDHHAERILVGDSAWAHDIRDHRTRSLVVFAESSHC